MLKPVSVLSASNSNLSAAKYPLQLFVLLVFGAMVLTSCNTQRSCNNCGAPRFEDCRSREKIRESKKLQRNFKKQSKTGMAVIPAEPVKEKKVKKKRQRKDPNEPILR